MVLADGHTVRGGSFSLVVLGWVLQTLLWGATDIGLGLLSGLS